MFYCCMVTEVWENNSEEINHSHLPIQPVLECEELNERNPFCQPIRILLLNSCWKENVCFQLCDWWSSYNFTDG